MGALVQISFYSPACDPIDTMLAVFLRLAALAPAGHLRAVGEQKLRDACAKAEETKSDYLVDQGITLLSGRAIASHLYFCSSRKELGASARLNGQVSLWLDFKALCAPLMNVIGKPIMSDEFISTTSTLLEDLEHLAMMLCCGPLGCEPDVAVQHAGMYLESGWASPVGCSMVYHSDILEFVADFRRIHEEYWIGGTTYEMLNPAAYLHERIAQSNGRVVGPLSDRPEYYRSFRDGDEPLCFVKSISVDQLDTLDGLSAAVVCEAFDRVVEEQQCAAFSCGMWGRGLVTFPADSLWHLYEPLWRALLERVQ